MGERSRPASKSAKKGHEVVAPPLRPRPHPGEEAILWTPWKLWVTETKVDAVWDVVLTHSVLAAILEQELRADSDVAGVLAGKLFRCPTSGRRWVRADSAWRSPAALPEACDVSALAGALGSAAFDAEDPSLVKVGWYHSHAHLGVALTNSESQFHEREFPKPWQFALIPVARSDPAGGVFQRGPGGVLSRTAYTPFYELPRTARPDGSRQTMIHWQNYTTDSRVYLIDSTSLRDLASDHAKVRSAGIVPQRLEGPATRPKRSHGGRPDSHHPHPTTGGDTPGAHDEGSGESRWRKVVATAIAAAVVALGGWFGWERYGPGAQAALEFSAPAEPATPGGIRSEPPSSQAAFSSAMTTLFSTLDAYVEAEGSPEASCGALASSVARAEQAFRDAATAYAALSVGSPGDGRVDYESAALRMVEVGRRFAGSGCARP